MLGANALLGEPLARQDILSLATENEGHPDNVVPAMLGGLVATVLSGDKIVSRQTGVSPMTITVVLPDFLFPPPRPPARSCPNM